MAAIDKEDVMKQVSDVAALAGLKGEVDADGDFRMVFGLMEGRSQMVFIRPTGTTPDDHVIVTFYSIARVIEKGLFKSISKKGALELLRLNNKVQFARFGIHESEKKVEVVASADHVLDTLDPDELKTTSFYVALAADMYEAKYSDEDLF